MVMTSSTSGVVAVAAIVLAAGRALRMGEQKVLLEVRGRSLIQRVVDAALGSSASETVVVLGHEAGRVRGQLEGRPVTTVVNHDYEHGMSASLRAGIRALECPCDAALFVLADQPFVSSALLDRLIAAFVETRKPIVRPSAGGTPSNPTLMSAALFPEILAQCGDVGGREIVARHPGEVALVPVDEPRLIVDIDTPAEYEAVRNAYDIR